VITQSLEILGEKIGELSAKETNQPRAEIAELLSAVGEQLTARVENLRLFEETERSQVEVEKRARQLAAVAEISTVSSQEMDTDKMLDSVVHLTQRQFRLYHAHIFLYDEKSKELKISACGWREGDEHEGIHETLSIPIDQEQSLVARAARTRQAIIINDTHGEPGWLPNPLLPDTASELAVPMLVGERVLGVLDVQSDHLDAFTEEDANIQTTLASQVAIALQNARSFTQAQRQAERETLLNVIGQKIRSATTVDAVLQIAARELGHALGAPLTIAQLGLKDKK
jgi:putative methionine-R-sulfoxide reductase with GAF domain